jgi:hypothetical protein
MVRHVICSRSDIFKGRWRTTSDLKAPTYKDRQPSLREATYKDLQPSLREATYKDLQPSLREATFRHEEANEHDSTQSVW